MNIYFVVYIDESINGFRLERPLAYFQTEHQAESYKKNHKHSELLTIQKRVVKEGHHLNG